MFIDSDLDYTVGGAPIINNFGNFATGYLYNLRITSGLLHDGDFTSCLVDVLDDDSHLIYGNGPFPCDCKPACEGKACGTNGCGGDCGVCLGPQDECVDGVCQCQPECEGKECGTDGCDGNCGECGQGEECVDEICGPCEDSPPLLWDKTHGGNKGDRAAAIKTTSDGGFVLAGYTNFLGGLGSDLWLVKTDGTGNLVWDKTYGGNNNDEAYDVAVLPDGGFVVAGTTKSKGPGSHAAWLLRMNASGDLLWDKTYGGISWDNGRAVVPLADGGFAMAGHTWSEGAGGSDFWLLRVDNSGNLLWEQIYGGADYELLYALVGLPDGGYALAGRTDSKGAGGNDFWLVRTNQNGDLLWDRTFGGPASDAAHDVQVLPDGGFVLAGHRSGIGWFVVTDIDGNLAWDKTYGQLGGDGFHAIELTVDGGLVLAGEAQSGGVMKDDFWLVRTDPEGNTLWEATFGGNDYDIADAIAVLPDGFAMAGYTASKGAGGDDFWLVRVGQECGP